jgi:hypothetical protein
MTEDELISKLKELGFKWRGGLYPYTGDDFFETQEPNAPYLQQQTISGLEYYYIFPRSVSFNPSYYMTLKPALTKLYKTYIQYKLGL